MSMMAHSMHLHGHALQVVGVGMDRIAGAVRDAVHVPPMSMATVAVVAGEAARWMLHCHRMPHLPTGMMTALAVSACMTKGAGGQLLAPTSGTGARDDSSPWPPRRLGRRLCDITAGPVVARLPFRLRRDAQPLLSPPTIDETGADRSWPISRARSSFSTSGR